jgi:O-antigen/teichoic acid export membrane protein
MSARREIPAGVLDAALSSLATFAMGFYAARKLQPTVLGAYGLVFTAFLLATRFPAQLIFKPAEIVAVSIPESVRLGILRRSLWLGLGPALVAALGIALWTFLAPAALPANVVVALTVTGVMSTFVSPIQDHVRHMLHLGDASWGAAGVSGVQFGSIAAAIWLLGRAHVPSCWVPFGALAIANTASLAVGLLLARGHFGDEVDGATLGFRELVHSGRWLLLVALLPTGAAFASAALVVHLAGSAAMGFAEAGRVLGQPPWVLSMGLAAVLGPRSIRAGQARQLDEARKVSRLFAMLMMLIGLPYLAVVGVGWSWSPLPRFIPNAYHISGLIFMNVVGNILIGMDWPYRSELIGAGRASSLARVEAAANAVRTAIGATAAQIGAFAIPVGYVALAVVRSMGYRVALRSLYAVSPRKDEPSSSVGAADPVLLAAEAQATDA